MGFLSDLLKREAKKMVSDVVDNKVGDTIKKYMPGKEENVTESAAGGYSGISTDMSEDGVRERLEQVFSTEWSDYEIRRNVPSSELDADAQARNYTYGMYKDGEAKLMIIVLNNKNHYCRKDVRLAHDACRAAGIPCINIMSYLPSTVEYISSRLQEELG